SLDPAAEYRVEVRNLVRSLTGKSSVLDSRTTFTTAPTLESFRVLGEVMKTPADHWVEADTLTPRPLVAADAAHDPNGAGRFVPFLGDDAVPVTAIQSQWLDGHFLTPRYEIRLRNWVTQDLFFHAPPGSSVRFFARTTGADVSTGSPSPYLVQPWVE